MYTYGHWSGSDTTSCKFGQGNMLTRLHESDMLQIEVQRHVSHAKKNMEEARGINIFRIIHGKKPEWSLNSSKHYKFIVATVSSNPILHPETLPPTKSTTWYHSSKVYSERICRFMFWYTLNKSLSLWIGVWTLEAHKLKPIRMDMAAAPDNVLQVTRYSCKGSNSAFRAYSCRKFGIPCVSACKNCLENKCTNREALCIVDEETYKWESE